MNKDEYKQISPLVVQDVFHASTGNLAVVAIDRWQDKHRLPMEVLDSTIFKTGQHISYCRDTDRGVAGLSYCWRPVTLEQARAEIAEADHPKTNQAKPPHKEPTMTTTFATPGKFSYDLGRLINVSDFDGGEVASVRLQRQDGCLGEELAIIQRSVEVEDGPVAFQIIIPETGGFRAVLHTPKDFNPPKLSADLYADWAGAFEDAPAFATVADALKAAGILPAIASYIQIGDWS